MHPKNYVSQAISNYYFEHNLPLTASQRNIQFYDKQNVKNFRNQIHHERDMRNLQCRQPLHDLRPNIPVTVGNTHYVSPKMILSKSNSTQNIVRSPKIFTNSESVERNVFKEKRSESIVSRKKSVKFLQKVEDFSNTGNNLTRAISHRSRSNSILKSRSKSKDSMRLQDSKSLKVQFGTQTRDYQNAVIRQKYIQIINDLEGKQGKLRVFSLASYQSKPSSPTNRLLNKYLDPSFPPFNQSISKTKCLPRITWQRISQLFPTGSVIRHKSQRAITIRHQTIESHHFSMMLNILKRSCRLLDCIFEDWKYNQKGVYILKIFLETQWRYTIIDDYIPIRLDEEKQRPAFLRAANGHQQIWPFLLEKAYAAYLGSYEQLHQLSLHNLFSDLLRLPLQASSTDQSSINLLIKKSLKGIDQQQYFYGTKRQSAVGKCDFSLLKSQKSNEAIQFLEQNNEGTFIPLKVSQLANKFTTLTKVVIPNLANFTSAEISSTNILGKQIKSRYFIKTNNLARQISYEQCKSKMALKSFTINKMQSFSVIVKHGKGKNSRHWIRVFIFQKQLDSYRWIQGRYSNDIISITCDLQPGQYYLLLVPDWSQESCHNFWINAYGQDSSVDFHSQNDNLCSNILEKGCSDLAQRLGKMKQINKWICSYSLVYKEAGIIIENINNQRRNGSIRIFRTIKNLKTKNCFLIPLNREFYQGSPSTLRNQAEIIIEKEDCTSVVLLLFGGLDSQFLNSFNFGT